MKENRFLLAFLYSNVILHRFTFLTNLNHFGLVHTKFLAELPMLQMNFLHKMVLHPTYIEIIYYLIIQKIHSYNLTSVVSCVFLIQLTMTFQNSFKMLIGTLQLLIPMNPFLMIRLYQMMTKPCHQMTFLHKLHQILILLQILTYLLNQFSKLLVLITPLTEPVTYLKTNVHHLLQILEISKLIII